MKHSKRFLAVLSLAVVLGVAFFAALSSSDLQGAVRNRRNQTQAPQIAVPAVSAPASAPINVPSSATPPSSGGTSALPLGSTLSAVLPHPTPQHAFYREQNGACPYYMEIGKWKFNTTTPFTFSDLSVYSTLNSANNLQTTSTGTLWRVVISRSVDGSNPSKTINHLVTSSSSTFTIPMGNTTLPLGANYILLYAKPNRDPSSFPSSTYTNTISLNGDLSGISNSPNVQRVKTQTVNSAGFCDQVTDIPAKGRLGKLNLKSTYQPVHQTGGSINVSSLCPISPDFEPVGQWDLEVNQRLRLERMKFRTQRSLPDEYGNDIANDYKVYISTDKTNYRGTALASFEHSSTQNEFTVTFGNGVVLDYDYGQYYYGWSKYYLTLEAKVKETENPVAAEVGITVSAELVKDTGMSWGTFSPGEFGEHAATTAEYVNYSRVVFINLPSGATALASVGRSLSQQDSIHPNPACVPAPDLGEPTAAVQNTLAINNVTTEACTGEGDWVAVHQATLNVGNPNRDLRLDFIPTEVKKINGSGLLYSELDGIKAVVSTTTDYVNSALGDYEYTTAPFSYVRIPTNGLVLEGGNTYYVTYLVKKGSTYSIASGGNAFGLQAKVSNQAALSPYGVFSPGTDDLPANNNNVSIATNTATNFYFEACSL